MKRYYFQFKWGRHSGFRYAEATEPDDAIEYLGLEFANKYGLEAENSFKLIKEEPIKPITL